MLTNDIKRIRPTFVWRHHSANIVCQTLSFSFEIRPAIFNYEVERWAVTAAATTKPNRNVRWTPFVRRNIEILLQTDTNKRKTKSSEFALRITRRTYWIRQESHEIDSFANITRKSHTEWMNRAHQIKLGLLHLCVNVDFGPFFLAIVIFVCCLFLCVKVLCQLDFEFHAIRLWLMAWSISRMFSLCYNINKNTICLKVQVFE